MNSNIRSIWNFTVQNSGVSASLIRCFRNFLAMVKVAIEEIIRKIDFSSSNELTLCFNLQNKQRER